MLDVELGRIREKLQLEGRSAIRHPFVVGKIRRILWPFIRSYHFIMLDWVRDNLLRLDGQSRECTTQIGERLRAMRAEMLAVSRQSKEGLDIVTETAAAARHLTQRMDGLIRDQDARLHELRRHFVGSIDQQSHHADDRIEELAGDAHQRMDGLSRDLGGRLDELERRFAIFGNFAEKFEFRIAQLEGVREAARMKDGTMVEGNRAAFPIGEAICVSTQFGPLILKRGDLITEHVRRTGLWDVHLLPLIAAAAHGKVAVDAGAHFGILSCAMAAKFEVVHAFETNEDNYLLLCANAALQPAGRIVAHHLGLYDRETELSLSRVEDQEINIPDCKDLADAFRMVDNVGALTFSPNGSKVGKVHAVTLDSVGLQDVGFIKIDCQGADGAVILGALDTIRRCRPVVVFEWEDLLSRSHGIGFERVEHAFRELNYKLKTIHTHNDKQKDYAAMPG
jgi:FkbM family methyltransferase